MFTFKDLIVFITGAQFFHTLNHALLPYFFDFPLHTKLMDITASDNIKAIAVNSVITVALILWAIWLSKRTPK